MDGVTTAIVAFIFVCVIWPHLVKNKPQFYAAFALVILIILLHSLAIMVQSAGFNVFTGAFTGIFQVGALVLLMLSAGGVTIREFGDELKGAYEVIRRGEEEKEIIVPIRGEMPKPKPEPVRPAVPLEGEEK